VQETDLALVCPSPELDAYWYAYQESGDLHTLAATFIMWGNNCQKIGKSKIKRENLKRETRGPAVWQE
jgi:hypothetical protein